MEKPKINNVLDLRNDLILNVYDKLRTNQIGLREAKMRVSTAGMIMKTCHEQREYNVYVKSNAKIEFLESDK